MAASYGSGHHSPPQIGRPVDRVFEEGQFTGEIYLNGRKLRDYPKICSKYELSDTIHVDVSKNRLTELPVEFCEYINVERINCYHNVIRSIPDAISQLQTLTHLNLSRNQLSVLTPALCLLGSLEVLSASNNKLVSLPEEIGQLENLMDLDVSCNEISHLPLQIGDLSSLRCLNLRRNFLVELPVEISRLQLCRLDFSSNRIEKIPTVFRKMETLELFILDHNPLASPPAYICTKGRQHIMKFLHIEAVKEDRKRGIMTNSDSDMKKFVRKSLPPQQPSDEMRNMLGGVQEGKWKRHTVLSNDSGYNSTGDVANGWQSGEIYPLREDHFGINNSAHVSVQSKPQPCFRNPPHHKNELRHHQRPPELPVNPYHPPRHSNSSPGPIAQSQAQISPMSHSQSFEGSYSDPLRQRRPSPSLMNPQHNQYAQYRQGNFQDNSSVYQHRATTSQSTLPQHQHSPSSYQHHGSMDQQLSPSNVLTISPTSGTSHNTSGAPSPSQNTPSLRSPYEASDLNRSLSPQNFHQHTPGMNKVTPVHARQNSNSSLSSNTSHSSRSSQHRSTPQNRSPAPSPTYLPPPPPPIRNRGGYTHNTSQSIGPHQEDSRWADEEDLPPPLPPLLPATNVVSVACYSPDRSRSGPTTPITPPTPPLIMTGNMEDEFTRELKRQKAEYDKKKRQAEQIRVQQEEEEEREKEERRKAAFKLQEEQRLVMERQEEQKRQEERLRQQREEEERERRRLQEEEERKKREEAEAEAAAARKREEELKRLQEAVRVVQVEEEKTPVIPRGVPKQQESKSALDKNKLANNYLNSIYSNASHRPQTHPHHHQQSQPQQPHRPAQPPPPPPPSRLPQPPSSLPLHGSIARPGQNSTSPSPSLSPSRLSQWQPQQHQQQNHRYQQQQQQQQDDYILSEKDYRNALSSQSLKEQQRLNANNTAPNNNNNSGSTNGISSRAPQQYRRAASDGLRRPGQTSQVENLNYINRNGGLSSDGRPQSRQSSTSTTPSVSPGPSPRNSVSHLAKPTPTGNAANSHSPGTGSTSSSTSRSPLGSQSQLAKPTKSSVPRASGNLGGSTPVTNGPSSGSSSGAQSQAVRRAKATGDRSNASSPVTVRSTRVAGPGGIARTTGALNSPAATNLRRGSNGSTTDEENKSKRGQSTPSEPTTRLKSRLAEPRHNSGLQPAGLRKAAQGDNTDNKRINTRPPTNSYGSGRNRAGAGRAGEESNLTIRRREEHQREEAEQMDRLRQTVESRLRVTLPDNLSEALRDGVVLCHLANQIRPRSVGSIHVPSPAVPKLTLAKCRRNVDNFLDACRKIGVDQEQICAAQDIFDEKGISRVALTVAALVAIGTNPKQSAV